jgi:hypothetical protein
MTESSTTSSAAACSAGCRWRRDEGPSTSRAGGQGVRSVRSTYWTLLAAAVGQGTRSAQGIGISIGSPGAVRTVVGAGRAIINGSDPSTAATAPLETSFCVSVNELKGADVSLALLSDLVADRPLGRNARSSATSGDARLPPTGGPRRVTSPLCDHRVRVWSAYHGGIAERVGVERFGEEVVGSGYVLAGVGPVGAGAVAVEVGGRCGGEVEVAGGEGVLDVGGHLAGEELGQEHRPGDVSVRRSRARAALTCSGCNSIHRPRTRTSGALHRAGSTSSALDSTSQPRATS